MYRSLLPAAAVAVALAAAGCSGAGRAVDDSSGTQRFLAGDGSGTFVAVERRRPAPVLRGTSIYDEPLDTSAYRGSVVVLNVWGSWCAPCKAEQPDLQRAAEDSAALGVRFVGIDVRDPGRVAPRRHVERFRVTYPSFYDPESRLVARFRDVPPRAIPTTIVLDRAGRVAARVFGPIRYDDLMPLLRRVAAEPR